MSIARYIQITEQIERILAQPVPPAAEMEVLREDIFTLVYARLGEVADYSDVERVQLARDFTAQMIGQRMASAPMRLRDKVVPAHLNYIKQHAARANKK